MGAERVRLVELVVVEGRDDITAVKRAVDAEVYAVHGFGVRRPEVLSFLLEASRRVGVIILTDPDRAGEMIRATIEKHVPEACHAYIMRSEGTREADGNIGVENASPEVIREALLAARKKSEPEAAVQAPFSVQDLLAHGLTGGADANARRQRLGRRLGIGYASAKQMLRRLHAFGITREEFDAAVEEL